MSGQYVSTGEFLEDNRLVFSEVRAAKAEIIGQNVLANQFQAEIATPFVLDDTLAYLGEQQIPPFMRLLAAQENVPYDELMARYDHVVNWLGGISVRLEALDQGRLDAQEANRIYQDVDRVVGSIPEIEERLQRTVGEEIVHLLERRRASAISEQAAAQSVYGKLLDALDIVGSMPIPQLLSADQRAQAVADVHTQAERVTADQFPVEPPERSARELVEGLRRSYGKRVARASQLLALTLAEVPGRTFTLAELADAIYGENTPNAPSRVSALVSNFENGKVSAIGDLLRERGLVLERGVRREVSDAGEPKGFPYVVLRAVSATGGNQE